MAVAGLALLSTTVGAAPVSPSSTAAPSSASARAVVNAASPSGTVRSAPTTAASTDAAAVRADLIVFLHPAEAEPTTATLAGLSKVESPDDRAALSLDDAEALQRAGVRLLPDADFALDAAWHQLAARPGIRRLLRLAFVQAAPSLRGGPGLRLYEPDAGAGELKGWLRLNATVAGNRAPPMVEVHLQHEGEVAVPTMPVALAPVADARSPAFAASAPTAPSMPIPSSVPTRETSRLDERRLPGRDGSVQYLDGGRLGVLIRLARVPVATLAPASAAPARPTPAAAAPRPSPGSAAPR